MIKKITLLFVVFIVGQSMFSQSNLNAYKYIIVPTTFEFTQEADAYKLNSLTKYKFEKKGFIVIMDNEPLPQELINNGCLVLKADVLKFPSIFKTKLQIQLTNCRQEVVFLSKVGESREKKYQVAFNFAIREAFESLDAISYQYQPAEIGVENTNTPPEVVIVAAESPKEVAKTLKSEPLTARLKGTLDYELLNEKGEVVHTLIFSGKADFYMVEGKQATVYKLNGVWVMANKISDGSLQIHTLNTTF